MVKRLLETGVELEPKDGEYGQTPLSWAVGEGREAVVRLLLEKGPSQSLKTVIGVRRRCRGR